MKPLFGISVFALMALCIDAGCAKPKPQSPPPSPSSDGPPVREVSQEYLQYYIDHFTEPGIMFISVGVLHTYHSGEQNGQREQITLSHRTLDLVSSDIRYSARITGPNGPPPQSGWVESLDCTGVLTEAQYANSFLAFLAKAKEKNYPMFYPDDRRRALGFPTRTAQSTTQQWQDFIAATPGYTDLDVSLTTWASPNNHPTIHYIESSVNWMVASPDDMGPNGNPDNQKLLEIYNTLQPILDAIRAACPVV